MARSSQPVAHTRSYQSQSRRSRSPTGREMQWVIPSINRNSPGASAGSANPNRLITPSTSTARIGRRLLGHRLRVEGRPPATIRRRAEHQSAGPQGPHPPQEEDRDPRPEVGPGPQAAPVRAPAARCLHACVHGDTQEAELGAAQGRPRAAHERHGGHLLHPRRGAQPPGALGGARARRPASRTFRGFATRSSAGPSTPPASPGKQSRSMYGVKSWCRAAREHRSGPSRPTRATEAASSSRWSTR